MDINSPRSYISPADQESLINLSMIQKNDSIDVDSDGRVGLPYDASTWTKEGFTNSLYRTTRSIAHLSSNRDDLGKIQQLMQRSLNGYLSSGDESLLHDIEGALKGLENLKRHYVEKDKGIKENKDYWSSWGSWASAGREKIGKGDCEKAIHDIEDIISNVNTNLKVKGEDLSLKIKPERSFELGEIEASIIQQGPTGGTLNDINEGIDYYSDKLQKFLALNEKKLTDDDKNFLNLLKDKLEGARTEKVNYPTHYQEVIHPLRGKISDEKNIPFSDAFQPAYQNFYAEEGQKLIDRLDALPVKAGSEIGVSMNMVINWEQEGANYNPGHAFLISICKEKDGTYTVAQANAGAFSLGDMKKLTDVNFHLKYHTPISISFPPIVEFKGLTQSELKSFLTKAEEMQYKKRFDLNYKNEKAAEGAYNDLFGSIENKKDPESRIPSRRSQVIGNCGLRSLKEEMIYAFQKAGKIDLANEFLQFGSSTLEYGLDPVKPFEK